MYRKLYSFAVLVLLCGIASAVSVPVFENEAFVSPWIEGNGTSTFDVNSISGNPADPCYASLSGDQWVAIDFNYVADPCWVHIGDCNFLDFDVYFDSSSPGSLIMGLCLEIDGDTGWTYKWEGTSQLSIDGDVFESWGGGPMLSQDAWHSIKVRLDTNNAGGDWPADPCAGIIRIQLSEASKIHLDSVNFNDVPTASAYNPSPGNNATGVAGDVTLQWSPGEGASSHTVYISTNLAEVENETVTPYTPGTPSQAFIADYAKTYYWKVVENDGIYDYVSAIWSFSTLEYVVIEDWNRYIDTVDLNAYHADTGTDWSGDEPITALYWDDGTFRDGYSMKLTYLTSSGTYTNTARLVYDSALDLTAHGIAALSFELFGNAGNYAEHVFAKLEDSSGNKGGYYITDTSYVQTAGWSELNVPLDELVKVDGSANLPNLSSIKKVRIGFGKQTPVAGGMGTVYIENIRLHPQRCVSSLVAGDLNNDCTVDEYDLKKMAYHWLYDPCNVPDVMSEPPQTARVYYKFDEGEGPTCRNEVNPGTNDADMWYCNSGYPIGEPGDLRFPVNAPGGDPNLYWDRWNENLRRERDASGVLVWPESADPEDPCFAWDPNGLYDSKCMDCEWDGDTGRSVAAQVPEAAFSGISQQITVSIWLAGDPCDHNDVDGGQIGGGYGCAFQGEDNGWELNAGEHAIMAIVPLPEADGEHGAVEWRCGNGTISGGDEQGAGFRTNQMLWLEGIEHPETWHSLPWNDEDTAWNHWAFVKDSGSGFMRIYCNGVAVGSRSTKFQPMSTIGPFYIGNMVNGDSNTKAYSGKIDEFRIYDYALSQAEVMWLAGRSGPDTPADFGASIADIESDAGDAWPGIVNFVDLSALAPNWQQTILFP